MKNKRYSQQLDDYQRIERAIYFLEANFRRQPSLDEIARNLNLSKYHFHRLFKRWAGISPAQFLQFLTLEYTKQKLMESHSILDTSFDAGLSGPGRLHDLFVTFEAMTPGEYKKQGVGMQIDYGFHATPFGECLLAVTKRGICGLGFVEKGNRDLAFHQLMPNWPQESFIKSRDKTRSVVRQIFAPVRSKDSRPFHLLLKGTNFQVKVWLSLLTIPKGTIVSYQDLAAYICKPTAARAVGNAVSINPIGYLIPCHRVIRKAGKMDRYRWGTVRKKAMLAREASGPQL